VKFRVAGCSFEGSIVSAGEISGWYECSNGRQQWFFTRVQPSQFEDCVRAAP
jgi:hypothetical protein